MEELVSLFQMPVDWYSEYAWQVGENVGFEL